MLTTASAILPIFLLIVVGYLFKRTGFIGDGFWAPAEKLVYFVLLPALIILLYSVMSIRAARASFRPLWIRAPLTASFLPTA